MVIGGGREGGDALEVLKVLKDQSRTGVFPLGSGLFADHSG